MTEYQGISLDNRWNHLQELRQARKDAKKQAIHDQRSRVVSLGNRLALTMSRRDAFIQAWAVIKAGGLELAVKGVTFGNRQEALRRLATYAPEQVRAFIVPEPTNPVDTHAVAVMVGVQGGKGLYRLGYVPRTAAPVVAAMLGKLPTLRVLDGDIRGARITLAA